MRLTAVNVVAVALTFCFACVADAAPATDVRVLIDVSGSMKKNDPANLRKPALRMLVELLPPESNASVWLFAKEVYNLVPQGQVDTSWKEAASNGVDEVHSRGLFTDIEAALQAATEDWGEADQQTSRNLILLTDGVVDVSKNPADSIESRQRLLASGLDRLKATGVRIHTIGLSSNHDQDLMQALASATDGWQESATDAANLQRIFLRMFEQAVQPDTVPLDGNKFQIDASISEFTLLVFNTKPEREVVLVMPDGSTANQHEHPDSFGWRVDNGYHLVTVSGPTSGGWLIDAELDPDNRVMIVTDLALEVVGVPVNILEGERTSVEALVTEAGEQILRPDFLDLLQVSATRYDSANQSNSTKLSLDAAAALFAGRLEGDLEPGRYELIVKADSSTFAREVRKRIVVHASPLQTEVVVQPTESRAGQVRINLTPDVISPDDVLVMATLTDEHGQQQVYAAHQDSAQALRLDVPAAIGETKLHIKAKLRSPSGRVLEMEPPALTLGQPGPVTPNSEGTGGLALMTTENHDGFDLKQGAIVIGGSNLGFVTLAGVTWAVCRRSRKRVTKPTKDKRPKKAKKK